MKFMVWRGCCCRCWSFMTTWWLLCQTAPSPRLGSLPGQRRKASYVLYIDSTRLPPPLVFFSIPSFPLRTLPKTFPSRLMILWMHTGVGAVRRKSVRLDWTTPDWFSSWWTDWTTSGRRTTSTTAKPLGCWRCRRRRPLLWDQLRPRRHRLCREMRAPGELGTEMEWTGPLTEEVSKIVRRDAKATEVQQQHVLLLSPSLAEYRATYLRHSCNILRNLCSLFVHGSRVVTHQLLAALPKRCLMFA